MATEDHLSSRRDFLQASSFLLGSLFALPARVAAARQKTAAPAQVAKPQFPSADTQMKFFADGRPRPFAGNTIICHLPQQCGFKDAVVDFGKALQASAVAPRLAFLPPESYHLTVFAGATDQARAGAWPSDIPPDASIEACNRLIGERLAEFHMQCPMPLRMRLDIDETVHYRGAITLRMVPVDDAEERKIRALRDRLAALYRYRAKDHDTYAFHIGIAYRLAGFTRREQEVYQALAVLHTRRIADAAPCLELGLPEFCTFHDMYRFDIQKLLNS